MGGEGVNIHRFVDTSTRADDVEPAKLLFRYLKGTIELIPFCDIRLLEHSPGSW